MCIYKCIQRKCTVDKAKGMGWMLTIGENLIKLVWDLSGHRMSQVSGNCDPKSDALKWPDRPFTAHPGRRFQLINAIRVQETKSAVIFLDWFLTFSAFTLLSLCQVPGFSAESWLEFSEASSLSKSLKVPRSEGSTGTAAGTGNGGLYCKTCTPLSSSSLL